MKPERAGTCPTPILVLQNTPRIEWRIAVNTRTRNSVDCRYVPADADQMGKGAHWIVWIEATSIDFLPSQIEEAKRQLKIKNAVMKQRGGLQ